MPRTIMTAVKALDDDTLLKEILGAEEVEYWIKTRKLEWLSFHTEGGDPDSKQATPWEFKRYFEIV
ncbi:MAG: hypothetical protein IIA75_03300 [Proteobacteria bacterium]|nr:hypothetical protein [Pseudomonadota bacterium]